MKKCNSELYIAISALIVSICAIAVSIVEGTVNRNHQRLLIKPHLVIGYSVNPAEGAGWLVRNSGLGPAQFRGWERKVGDKKYDSWEAISEEYVDSHKKHRYTVPSYNWIYNAGEKNPLYRFEYDSHGHKKIQETLRESLEIEICYCSMYEDCWSVSNLKPVPDPVPNCDGWAS